MRDSKMLTLPAMAYIFYSTQVYLILCYVYNLCVYYIYEVGGGSLSLVIMLRYIPKAFCAPVCIRCVQCQQRDVRCEACCCVDDDVVSLAHRNRHTEHPH